MVTEQARHSIGIILSVFGIILTSIGVVGEERLRKWENSLQKLSKNAWHLFSIENIKRVLGLSIWFGLSLALLFWAIALITFITNGWFADFLSKIFPFFDETWGMCWALAICLPFFLGSFGLTPGVSHIILFTLRLFIWMMLIPYRILDTFVEHTKMKSTLQVLGIVISIIGLLLIEL